MFLKSLTLRGFKTFADATEIQFGEEARITAIVGPNGCGKSNLLDATRWVLGEDNPRELRVASLENIIFAGTAQRKPLSLAEVSLLLDNSSGKLPIPFTEVSIRRRTFREGESEFFINKNACRLKDIRDLLLDTGLGEGTYAIITQGKVDAVLSTRGEERRAIFEEAAGINKYKVRKIAAEKKLIAAEQNILRINDLKVEVAEHLLNLEEQAHKARTYLEIQKRIRETEIGLYKKLLGGLLEKRAKFQAELQQAQKLAAEKIIEAKQKEEEKQKLKEQLRKIEEELESLSAQLELEKDRERDLELNRRFLEGEIAREQRRKEEIEKKKKEIEKKLEALSTAEGQGEKLEGIPLASELNLILKEIQVLFNLFSFLVTELGGTCPVHLLGEKEKEEARKLKIEILTAEIKSLEEELERVTFGLEAYRKEQEGLLSSAKDQAKSSLLEKISQLKLEKEKINQRISELESGLALQAPTSDSITPIEIALAKIEGEMSGLQEKIALEYNFTLEEIQAQPYEVSSISKAKLEVEEGKKKLKELEPVNLLAIEECEKSKERLSFIEAQLADLNAARENLQYLIAELDLRAEETFAQTIEQLSQIFSETFSRLFIGGEARISLSPGQSPLTAEIEISVRPSGRKWLPLTMLSGGERALAAIAILFSLLKIRPSPFCFLDEVDAALDEANIGRFIEMLKAFSQNTQIIIITHNKKTMAAADNIYGITMEEPGVSKVISMKLAEVAA